MARVITHRFQEQINLLLGLFFSRHLIYPNSSCTLRWLHVIERVVFTSQPYSAQDSDYSCRGVKKSLWGVFVFKKEEKMRKKRGYADVLLHLHKRTV